MKKTLMTAVLMTVMTVASAQNEPGTLTVQPKGGFGLATLTNVDKAEMVGIGMFGGELEYALKEKLSIGAGINFDIELIKKQSINVYEQSKTQSGKGSHDAAICRVMLRWGMGAG